MVSFFYAKNKLVNKKRRPQILGNDTQGLLNKSDLKDFVIGSLEDDKAFNIEAIELDDQFGLADYIIVASGTSSTQTTRMAEKLKERLHLKNITDIRIEGASQGDWVVLDAGDVIVHIFRPEVRDFYNIEKMWAMDSVIASYTIPPAQRA
ncbi:MAG: ribosome silencing factor [Pseudomonadota bacterium]